MALLAYAIKRMLLLIPLILIISLIIFSLFLVVPGDPAALMMGEYYTAERYQYVRRMLGLDDPLYVRYFNFVNGLLHGNFGYSLIISRGAVSDLVFPAFKATLELTVVAIIISVTIGLIIAIVASVKRYSVFDYGSMGFALLGCCLPYFWTGMILIIVFSVILGWFPVSGRIDVTIPFKSITGLYTLDSILTINWEALKNVLLHLALPALTLSLEGIGVIARMTRSSMLEVLSQNYITTARSVGFPKRVVVFKYALKNALIPTVTFIGSRFSSLLGGAILTETVFAWPGLGRLTISAILNRDYTVVVACVVLFSVVIVTANLIVDILYSYLDPRIRY